MDWADCESAESVEPRDYGSKHYWEAHFASAPSGSAADPEALEFEWL